MQDSFGRQVSYLRVSVTDRCNLRCRYCMAEDMQFLPRDTILSYEEIYAIVTRFMAHGIDKVRLTGGEPLVRRDIVELVHALGRHIASGDLAELTMTTNGTLLAQHAQMLADNGIRRINVSLDSLDPETFAHITRRGRIEPVLAGIAAAKEAGLRVKINMLALGAVNRDSLLPMAQWCAREDLDLTLIETMPLGETGEDREEQHVPLEQFLAPLTDQHDLLPLDERSSGPARYVRVGDTGLKLGLITPLSANFCDGCNRLRLTTEGKIYPCLGHALALDFKAALREGGLDAVDRLLQRALQLKPERHEFNAQLAGNSERLERHMSVTGG